MTAEVLRGVAEGAVKTAMSIEPMVMKSASVETIAIANLVMAYACVPLVILLAAVVFSMRK